MARKRMFASDLIQSDRFILISHEAQLLYFHLCLRADDEGFLRSPQAILKTLDMDGETLEELIRSELVYRFDSGIVLILDWHQHNYIRKDRFVPTNCQRERQYVRLDSGGFYHVLSEPCEQTEPMTTIGQPDDNQPTTQYREEKNRREKNRKGLHLLKEETYHDNYGHIGLVI